MPELVDGTSSSTEPARGVVLVALPAASDPVHTIGPEEKHVTLAYLGKTDELPLNDQGVPWYTFEDVKDAVTRWLADPSAGGPLAKSFSATTNGGVSSLGEENARVWMFDSPKLVALHDALLTIQTVKDLAGKVDQFPSYLPHTTIGYPTEGRTTLDPATEAAAGAVDAVTFDRLALWWGDKRVEWPLTARGGNVTEQDLIKRALELSDRRAEAGMAPTDVLANFMKHAKEWTIQDVVDSLSSDQRDVFDIVVAASLADEELEENEELARIYDSFNDEQELALGFVVGFALDDPELEHSGTKGMKWGVRKGEIVSIRSRADVKAHGGDRQSTFVSKAERTQLKADVKSGNGLLIEAHMAALKSRGHRVTNAMLGDKTYWKRTGVTTAATAAIIAAGIFAPGVVPAAAMYAGVTATSTAQNANSISALVRAVRGNARISKSVNTHLTSLPFNTRQTAGNKQVQKILNQNGSIPKKALTPAKSVKQSESSIGYVLRHAGILGMKWGVRRKPGPDGTVTSAVAKAAGAKDSASDTVADGVRARSTLKAIQRSGISSVSDGDLRHLTSRLQLEKQFSDVDKSVLGKLDTKVNKLLKYGDTMNRAIKFTNSKAGQELSFLIRNKTAGSHAKTPLARLLPKAEEAAAAAAAKQRAETLAKVLNG